MTADPIKHPLCTAKSKRSGEPCQRMATPGTTVCASHGSRAPQVKAAARRRLNEAAALDAAHRFGVPIETTATDALLSALARKAGHVAWLRHGIARSGDGRLVADVHDVGDVGGDPAVLVLERLKEGVRLVENPLLAVLRAEERALVETAAACHKAGIDEARIDMHRSLADLMLRLVPALLVRLGFEVDESRMIDAVVGELAMIGTENRP